MAGSAPTPAAWMPRNYREKLAGARGGFRVLALRLSPRSANTSL
jgi:hypothetical protein